MFSTRLLRCRRPPHVLHAFTPVQASASCSPRVYSGAGVRLIEDGEYRPAGGRASRTEAVRTLGVPEAPEALCDYPRLPAGLRGRATVSGAHASRRRSGRSSPGWGDVTRKRYRRGAHCHSLRRRGRRRATSRSEFNLVVDDQQHIFTENLTLRGGRIGVVARGSSHHGHRFDLGAAPAGACRRDRRLGSRSSDRPGCVLFSEGPSSQPFPGGERGAAVWCKPQKACIISAATLPAFLAACVPRRRIFEKGL